MISVTQALSIINRYGNVSPATLARAAELGIMVHAHCLGHLKGFCLQVPDEITGYVEAFKQWADAMIDEVVAVEHEVVSQTYQLIGHVDLVARLKKHNSGASVIDLKRTAAKPDWIVGLQLSAYQQLCPPEWKVKHRYALHAQSDYKMHLIPFTRLEDWMMFLNAYSLYNYSNARR